MGDGTFPPQQSCSEQVPEQSLEFAEGYEGKSVVKHFCNTPPNFLCSIPPPHCFSSVLDLQMTQDRGVKTGGVDTYPGGWGSTHLPCAAEPSTALWVDALPSSGCQEGCCRYVLIRSSALAADQEAGGEPAEAVLRALAGEGQLRHPGHVRHRRIHGSAGQLSLPGRPPGKLCGLPMMLRLGSTTMCIPSLQRFPWELWCLHSLGGLCVRCGVQADGDNNRHCHPCSLLTSRCSFLCFCAEPATSPRP